MLGSVGLSEMFVSMAKPKWVLNRFDVELQSEGVELHGRWGSGRSGRSDWGVRGGAAGWCFVLGCGI